MKFRKMDRFQKVVKGCLVFFFIALVSCSGGNQDSAYTLTLVHLNDTHSHLEPVAVNFWVNDVKTTVQAGGFARLKTAIDRMRAIWPDLLLLHGGDAVRERCILRFSKGRLNSIS